MHLFNPYTGRFISEDSYWGEDVNPLSLNRYTYVYNDPIQYVDPSGHWGGKAGEYDDSQLSTDDQRKVKNLTDSWFSAKNDNEREEIHQKANEVRANAKNTGSSNADSFGKEANKSGAIKSMPKAERDVLILRIKAIEGISQRQAARILGVAPNIVIRT